VAALFAALCLSGLAAPPAAAAPPTDTAFGWGANFYGQLGNGTLTNTSTPVAVSLPAGTTVTALSTGVNHTLAVTSDGHVLAWGDNARGQLGDGTFTNSTTPVAVSLPAGTTVTAVSAGYWHSLALTSDGRVLAWGWNFYGEVGDGTTTTRSTPVPVSLPAGTTATAVSAGGYHSLALTSDGRVFGWGWSINGQVGDGGTTNRTTPVPAALPAGTTATAISAGQYHSLAVTSDGGVLAWGQNTYGQLGDGTTTQRNRPVAVALPAGTTVTAVAAGWEHSLALTSDGGVLAWGDNRYGQLGDGTNTSSTTPVAVALPAGTTVTAIAAGYEHSLALTPGGSVLAWGRNTFGQLGDGTTTDRNTPVLTVFPAGVRATAITAADYHSLALAERATSHTTLTASPTTVAPGATVTLTAHVTCSFGTPTGDVVFQDGNTPIGTVTLDAAGDATLTVTTLALGAHEITAHYQGDGTCPPSVSEQVVVIVEEPPVPALTLDKQAASTGPFQVGDTVAYTYTVTNTGNTALHDVTVTDDLVTTVTCDVTALAPGEATTCRGNHTITQADITPCTPAPGGGCELPNLAQVTAFDPNSAEVASDQAEATIVVQVPLVAELALSKRVDSAGPFLVGDTVAYAYTVTNTGDAALSGITVTDDHVTAVTCDATTLTAGQSTTCRGSHTITQADITPCELNPQGGCLSTNLAQATATDPQGEEIASNQATATIVVQVPQTAELTLTKKADSAGPFQVGDTVAYAYTVTNTGDAPLNGVTVTDDRVATVTCDATTLAAGASTTCRGSYTVTKADAACTRGGNGGGGTTCPVTNTAQATATDPQGDTVTSDQATATIQVNTGGHGHDGYEKKKEKKKGA
jgi:uncharacterized repeat protein (TIGR01451 family)